MHLFWVNWRDIKNPEAGGAEVFTQEVMTRLVRFGYELTLFSSQFKNGLDHEDIAGIHIIREGTRYSVYQKARDHYIKFGDHYDVIIDEINTRPFLTPKFVKGKPILALFHQMAREFWFYETPFPLNYIGYYYLEKKWLSYYRDVPTVTVSESSKKDLEELGFKKIFMAPEGLSVTPLSDVPQKEPQPTIIYTGRLKKAKLPHHAIQAFSIIKQEIPDAKMWVLGDGYMMDELKSMNVKDVTFYGHVKNELKYELMGRAHLALVPAVREGWGLVVTESNAMGTPAVAYNVPGLRDSVRDELTGILVENTPEHLARAAIMLLKDGERLARLSHQALEYSKNFSWDNTTDAFDRIIKTVLNKTQ